MKITFLDGDLKQGGNVFSDYLEKLATGFRLNNSLDIFHLNKMNLHFCTGCCACWWKTPVRCAIFFIIKHINLVLLMWKQKDRNTLLKNLNYYRKTLKKHTIHSM